MSNTGSICQHCGYRAHVPALDCPRCRRPYSTMIQQSGLAQNSTMQIPGAVPPAPGPPYAPVPACSQPGAQSSNRWHMVNAVQSGVLILLLAAAVFLLYRHETWLQEGGQPGAAPGANERPINVVVDHPTVIVTDTNPLPRAETIHTGPTSRATRVGHTASLSSFITDRNYDPIPLGRLRWNSRNPDVASVDGYGNVTGCSPGVAAITVTDTTTNASGTISIRVERDGSNLPNYPPGQPQIRFSTIPRPRIRNGVLDNRPSMRDPNRMIPGFGNVPLQSYPGYPGSP